MKGKLGTYFFIFFLPTATSIGLLLYLSNKGNRQMIEIDASAIIVAVISAFVTLLGIIIVEIVGWRKTLDKLKQQEKDIGVNENRVCLSQQHDNISNSMSAYKEEIKTILKDDIIKDELNSSHTTLNDIYRIIKDNDIKNKYRDSAIIAANETKLLDSHKYVEDLFNKYADALSEVKDLQKEKQSFIDKINTLMLNNTRLKDENNSLRIEIEKTKQEFEQYVQQEQNNNEENDEWTLGM